MSGPAAPRRRNSHIFDQELQAEVEEAIHGPSDHPSEELARRTRVDVELQDYRQMNIDHEDGVFCLKWSGDGQYLAAGCSDGDVRVMTRSGRFAFRLRTVGNMPMTALRWKPSPSGVEPVLVSTTANGHVNHWHVPSQKALHSIVEEDNQIFALDFRPDGLMFATAGKDKKIRLYDEDTKQLVTTMERGYLAQHPGHSNRIFALKFKPDDPNVILSGSWDDTVLYWDVRSGQAFRSIFGPHIAGQTVDIQNDVIICGSWRSDNAIGLYEFTSAKLIANVDWRPAPMTYSCCFSPDRENIAAAGGTGVNELRLLDTKNKIKSPPVFLPGKEGIYTLDFDPLGNLLAFGGHSSVINVMSLRSMSD